MIVHSIFGLYLQLKQSGSWAEKIFHLRGLG